MTAQVLERPPSPRGARPDWARDSADWPHREVSRFVRSAGLDWHVQRMGSGPPALLLHGAGGATHSMAALMESLAPEFDVIVPDLPSHGFTGAVGGARSTLPAMAASVRRLMDDLGVAPALIVGHSAGAAIGLRAVLDGMAAEQVIAINGALHPFEGLAGALFPPIAKVLVMNPFVPAVFSTTQTERATRRLIEGTGSKVPEAQLARYHRLFKRAGHASGALRMMASWDLEPLARDLPRLSSALTLIVGTEDRAVSPDEAEKTRALVPSARIVRIEGGGHLVHETHADAVADAIRATL